MNLTGYRLFPASAAVRGAATSGKRRESLKLMALRPGLPWSPRSKHEQPSHKESTPRKSTTTFRKQPAQKSSSYGITSGDSTGLPSPPPQYPSPDLPADAPLIHKRRIRVLPPGRAITDYFDFPSLVNTLSPNKNDFQAEMAAMPFLRPGGPLRGPPQTHSRPLLLEAREKASNVQCIAKILQKSSVPPTAGADRLWRQLCHRLLACPSHPNILPFYGIFEDADYFYLFFEKLQGGELFDFLLTEAAVPEELCKHIIRQILLSLEFLHGKSIVHRDVKPENLMFRFKRPPISKPSNAAKDANSLVDSLPALLAPYELVLIDFDTCRLIDAENESREWSGGRRRLVGTYGYLAPEILRGGDYSPASDLWSVGVILYVLMTGIPPVPMGAMKSARESQEALARLEQRGIGFDYPPLTDFPLARDLCMRLLDFDPEQRLRSCTAALQHPWLLSSAALSARYFCASPLACLMPQSVAAALHKDPPVPLLAPNVLLTNKSLLSEPPPLTDILRSHAAAVTTGKEQQQAVRNNEKLARLILAPEDLPTTPSSCLTESTPPAGVRKTYAPGVAADARWRLGVQLG